MDETEKKEKINVYDENATKQILDDWVRESVLRKYPSEDYTVNNFKILFGAISCMLGVYAHYGVGPWPAARLPLVFCVASFLVLQGALRYIAHYYEKDYILTIYPHQGQCFMVRTQFHKDSGNYEVELVDKKGDRGTKDSPVRHKFSKSITEYFDKQGQFYGNILELHMIEAMDKFVAKVNP